MTQNIVISESARTKMTAETYSKIMGKIKEGSKSNRISGFKILRRLSSIIIL